MSNIPGLKEQLRREIANLDSRFKAYLGLEYREEMLADNLAALDRIVKLKLEIDRLSVA